MALKKNNPGCNCCAGAVNPTPCTDYCTSSPYYLTVTLANWQSNGCAGCVDMNDTFILTPNGICNWKFEDQNICRTSGLGDVAGSIDIRAQIWLDPALSDHVAWLVQAEYSESLVIFSRVFYRWDSGGVSAIDCTATRSLTNYSQVEGGSPPPCQNLASTTCQLN